jgi:hypothetical protein
MFFWNKSKKRVTEPTSPNITPRRTSSGRRFPVEVKLLAAQASEAGLAPKEVVDLIGASLFSVSISQGGL